ncbi:MAG: amino acid ABC transporter permease [Lachnospiraceae bacterium]|nr:amino acid ABC transporter permease [Lachnospiraceae bacterium]
MGKIFDIEQVFTLIPQILKYLPVTLELTAVAMTIGIIFGLILAVIRVNRVPVLSQIAAAFVSLIRGTPVLVQLYITYFGIPILLRYINQINGTDYSVNGIPNIVFAFVALGFNQSAFTSETFRAAILSVEKGQIEAAKSLGMTGSQVLHRVIMPQAFQVALLPLGNSLISLIKGTSLAFSCAVVEMTAGGKILVGRTARYFEMYLALAIIYWIITIIIEQAVKLISRRIDIPEEAPEPGKA